MSTLLTKSRSVALLAVATAATVAACGGDDGPKNATARALASCTNKQAESKGYEVITGDVIESASKGLLKRPENAILVTFKSDNGVFIVAEQNKDDADATERDFKEPRFGTDDVSRKGNVIVGWTKKPTDAERAAIDACV